MQADDDVESRGGLEAFAFGLAVAGFIPFAVLSIWLVSIANDHVWRGETIVLLKVYGALILSFLGGARFGMALADDAIRRRPTLAISVLPALVGWVACWLADPASFALLAVAFAAQGAWDSVSSHRGETPAWYGRMRVVLTGMVVVVMVIAFLETA